MVSSEFQDAAGLRVPPHDISAERSVVGALMLNQDSFAEVIDLLQPHDFYAPNLEIIYEAQIRMFADAKPVDAITLADELEKTKQLAKVGGRDTIIDIVSNVTSTANVGYYANIVKERSTLRKLIAAGTRIEQLGYTTEGADVKNAVDLAESAVFELSKTATTQDYISLREGLVSTKNAIKDAANVGDIDGVPTGINLLDHYLHGLKSGQMIVVAARPGVGKSTLALDIARNAAIKHKIPTIYFNLEMAHTEMLMRLVAAEKSIDHERLQTGKLRDDEWQRIEQFERSLISQDGQEVPLFIDDSANISLMQIRTKCRRLFSKLNDTNGLVIVDYLQLMSSGQRVESRQQEVADISRKLKLLAKEIGVPIIAIAQLNRGSEARSDKRPQLSDLRESGAIEQDADVVILIHREEMYHTQEEKEQDPDKYGVGKADIIIAKNRAGRTGDFEVSAQMHLSRFQNLAQNIE